MKNLRKYKIKKINPSQLSSIDLTTLELIKRENIRKAYIVQMKVLFFWITIKEFLDEDEDYAQREAEELLFELQKSI